MNANEAILKRPWTLRFRLLGLLPLCFFIVRGIEYIVLARTPEQMLWSCHISNLMLAVGLFIASPFLIRVSAFWLILGLPAWIYATTVNNAWFKPEMLVSIFSHVGGAIVSIIAVQRVGAKLGSWIPSLIYFVILQQITRLLTNATPYTNVNVSHFAYGPMKDWFSSYWTYLVVNTTSMAILLIILEYVLLLLFPSRRNERLQQGAVSI